MRATRSRGVRGIDEEMKRVCAVCGAPLGCNGQKWQLRTSLAGKNCLFCRFQGFEKSVPIARCVGAKNTMRYPAGIGRNTFAKIK